MHHPITVTTIGRRRRRIFFYFHFHLVGSHCGSATTGRIPAPRKFFKHNVSQ
jgi:hypothetical protein